MDKKRLVQGIALASILTFGQPEPVFACDSAACQSYDVLIEYTTSAGVTQFSVQRSGGIGALSVGAGLPQRYNLYLTYNIGCGSGTRTSLLIIFWINPPSSYRIIRIGNCYLKKYVLWVDIFRGNKGILWGMFKGAPDGCTVVGALVDGDNSTLYKGNLSNSEVDFGYQLAKGKEGYQSPPVAFEKLPVNYRASNYEEYYFYANWVNPNCYWQVREVRRNSFSGIFDFLWNIFK